MKKTCVANPLTRNSFRLVLALSSCATALIAASPASAQNAQEAENATSTAAPEEGEEIVVSTFRKSIETALEKKREDIRVTDGISAEDIGKFPAENITEAIQRISGVQMSNINGRGATISIRGLGPQYALTTINGQTFKSADFTDGFRYDIIQTELASAIEVIKSPIASMDTGGLSGTVNINTPKPLDFKNHQLVVSVKGQNSEYAGDKITPKVSASYLNQFLDNTLGVYINLGYQKLTDRADYFWLDRWTTQTIDGQVVQVPRRPRYRRIDRDTERLMASGGLQWRPSDRLELNATAIFARDNTDYDVNQQVFSFDTSRIAVNQITNGVATNVTATNFNPENNRQQEDRNLTSQGYTLGAKWNDGTGWLASTTLNYTKGRAYQREEATIVGYHLPSATLDFTDPDAVSFELGSDLNDPNLYARNALNRNEWPNGATRVMTSTEKSAQLDLAREVGFGPISKISVGAKFRHETFQRDVSRHDMLALLSRMPAPTSSIFPDMTTDHDTVSNFLGGGGLIQSGWFAPNSSAYGPALAAAGISIPEIYAPEASYRVDRYMPGGYLMADINTTLAGATVRGNIGVRYEHTTQRVRGNVTAPRSDGYVQVQQDIGDYSVRQRYDNWLPSLSLVIEPSSTLQVRFAAAKVLVRPIMDSNTSMAQTTSTVANTYPVGTNTVTVDLGQASLQPLTAKQLDLGVEWYFDRGSALALNGFYKWIKNGTYSSLVCPGSFNGRTLSRGSEGCADTAGNIYDITQTLNDPSTIRVKGFEVSWNQSFDRLLPVDGFGLMANFTRVYPQSVAIGTGYTIRNLSKKTWNLVPYWENDHFNIRAAINYRSSYEQNSADSFFAYAGHTVRARTQVDISGGYSPNDYLSFSAGVINLNNSREEAYYTDPSIWQESSHYGRSFYLSATLKL